MNAQLSLDQMNSRPLPMEAIILAHQLVLFPLYFFVPIWIAVINSVAAGLVLYSSRTGKLQIPRLVKVLITLIAILAVFVVFRKLSGRDAGVAFISVMYGLKILEINSRRDAYLILTLSFFILVSGFFFSQKPWIALYQFIPVIAVLNAFIAIHSLQQFKLASASLSGVLKVLSRYLLIAIPIMVVLFIFFPRLSGPLWRMPGAQVATSGVSDYMGLSEITSMQLSENIAFRVKFNGDTPKETDLYWRVLILDEFDGLAWQRSHRLPVRDNQDIEAQDVYEYSITMEPTKLNYLISLDKPVTSPDNGMMVTDQTIVSRFRVFDRMRYTIQSVPSLQLNKPLTPRKRQQYLALPDSGNRQARGWAEDLRENVNSDKEFVEAILQEINSEEYFYTLTPGVMDQNLIDSFWLDIRKGFCEHYASSLAFLARAVGIPARVIIGYQGGEKNPLGDYWIVRDANAHAWVEVWYEDQGWVRVDPTAAIASHRIEENILQDYAQRISLFDDFDVLDLDQIGVLKQFQYWLDEMNTSWNDWILDYNRGRQQQFFRNWGMSGISDQTLFISMLILAGLFVSVSGLKWFHRNAKIDPVAKAFEVFVNRLNKKNLVIVDTTTGPQELIDKLNQLDENQYKAIVNVLERYLAFRYQANDTSSSQAKVLEKDLRKLRV